MQQGGGGPPGGPPSQRRPPSGGSFARRAGVFLLAVLLLLSAVSVVGMYAAQGTVLNDEYVADTLAEEGVYAELETNAEDLVIDETRNSLGRVTDVVPSAERIVEQTVREVVTESYVSRETERNLEHTYDYLHGRSSTLDPRINTEPVVDNISVAVEQDVRNFPVADILEQTGIERSFQGYPIDFGRVGAALNNEDTFNQVQQNIRQSTELAGLTSDEINASVRERFSPPPQVVDSVYRIQGLVVLAMTTEMPYDEFRTRLERARGTFAVAAGEYAEQQVRQQVPAEIVVFDELDSESEQQIRTGASSAARAVQLVDSLTMAVPLLALVIVVAVLWLSHSLARTARNVGITLAIAGGLTGAVGLLGTSVVTGLIRNSLADVEDVVISTAVTIVTEVFARITTYSVALLVVGALLLVVWFGLRRYEPSAIPAGWR